MADTKHPSAVLPTERDSLDAGQGDPEKAESNRDSNPDDDNNDDNDNVVDWDGDDDPENPRNWTAKAKILNTSLVIVLTLLTPLASSMFAPGVPEVLRDFHTDSDTIAELVVSIYLLGFAVGPLLISPLSEIYGRYRLYVVCNIMFLIFTVACAVSSSISQLIVFRFFAGCFGVCPVTLGGASIADLIAQDKRGAAISLFSMGPLLGPVIGPVAGAFLASAEGWRWTFWVIAIAYAICTVLHMLFCRETYHPVLLLRKTAKLQKQTGNTALRSKLDDGLSKQQRISRGLVRPLKMLIFSPIVSLMALYCAVVYGILYLLYTTFTFVFERYYDFSSNTVGLTFIPSGIGMILGVVVIGLLSDRLLKSYAARGDGQMKPEYRLLPLMYSSWLVPIGLFIYGWTAQTHQQWAVPLFGTLLFGIGIIAALICIQQYLIDAYAIHAASAVAANTVLRSILGGLLPLAGLSMYDTLGLGWGNSLLAFVSLAMIPIPFFFFVYGERLRRRGAIGS